MQLTTVIVQQQHLRAERDVIPPDRLRVELDFVKFQDKGIQNTHHRCCTARISLNNDIVQLATQLAVKMDAREHILNRNSFTLDNTVHITDLIDKAATGNGHYRSRVQEPLRSLGIYELKYWPSLQEILRTLASEPVETGFLEESDKALVSGRGELVPDYLRELFSHIETVRTCHWGLPEGFRLTDASLAALATVSLDLPEPASVAAVKMHRTRLSREGFPGAWPIRKKKPAAGKPRRDDSPVRPEPGA